MRVGGIYDPRYATHVRPGLETSYTARAEVWKPTGEFPGWVEGEGMQNNMLVKVWEGPCRAQPNIDWRARVRDVAGEFDATHAVRFNIPIGKNEFNAVRDADGKITAYAPDPEISMGYVVRVVEVTNKGSENLLHRDYTVRNSLPSTTMWEHNLLCDVGTNPHG